MKYLSLQMCSEVRIKPVFTVTEATPFATVFSSMFYVYYARRHHHTNIILSIFITYFVLKYAAKILKIGLQKKTMFKNNFE